MNAIVKDEVIQDEFNTFNMVWSFTKKWYVKLFNTKKASVEDMSELTADMVNVSKSVPCKSFAESMFLVLITYFSSWNKVKTDDTEPNYTVPAMIFNRVWKIFKVSYPVDYESEEDWAEIFSMCRAFEGELKEKLLSSEIAQRDYQLGIDMMVAATGYLEKRAEAKFNKMLGA